VLRLGLNDHGTAWRHQSAQCSATDCTSSQTTCLLRYPLFLRHSTFLSISLRPSAVNIIRTGHAPRRDACALDDAPCGAPVITDVTDNRPSSRLSRTAQRTRRVYCCVPGRLQCVDGIWTQGLLVVDFPPQHGHKVSDITIIIIVSSDDKIMLLVWTAWLCRECLRIVTGPGALLVHAAPRSHAHALLKATVTHCLLCYHY
jgi:hypothetical protein